MDIKAWRKSANGKAYTIRIGSTWVDNKGVMRLNFDALPLPDERGKCRVFSKSHANAVTPRLLQDPARQVMIWTGTRSLSDIRIGIIELP